ncbi:MAG TPA: hypothetical protein PLW65_08280 [Pseudomonadota bacterium]|nr:hypothetical protein [Pseudomonadota bacterium]
MSGQPRSWDTVGSRIVASARPFGRQLFRATFSSLKLGLALGLALPACHHTRPGQNDLVRYRGPVRLALTAASVAPGKEDGRPWDGLGSLPPEVVDGLRAPRPRGFFGTLFRELSHGGALSAIVSLLPWTANAFVDSIAAPDVQIEISVNGQLLTRSPIVRNSFLPTWAGVYTRPIVVSEFDHIELKAVDRDIAFHDQIGVCTSQGLPWVDSHHGYAAERTFQCYGQLWAVALRVIPAESGEVIADVTAAPEQDGD